VAFRKYYNDKVAPGWRLYKECMFLRPFVNIKPERKTDYVDEDIVASSTRIPLKSPFDEGALIKLVQARPQLYDKHHEEFRSPTARRKAFQEISKISGWEVRTLQKRWRVMRDRFVRELRRTRNTDTETLLDCSTFFRDMLFLARHVRSKSYEVEADFQSDASLENWELQDNGDGLVPSNVETCIVASDLEEVKMEEDYKNAVQVEEIKESYENRDDYATDDPEYLECFEDSENAEQVVYEDESDIDEATQDYASVADDDINLNSNDQRVEGDVLAAQEIHQDQWVENETPPITTVNSERYKKQKSSDSTLKRKSVPEEEDEEKESTSRTHSRFSGGKDEDVAFGETIGLMLKKIPNNYKTHVKILLLQCLSEFETKHNLT
jgi:Alcohol dehydrogenase transcription factor Myb/SANT-like